MPLTHTSRTSLADQVLDQLRQSIARGDWPIGERIPTEEQLAAQLGVGRNTVREAVRALVHGGMLETRQGAGTYVITRRDPAQLLQQMDYATLAEWLEVRQMLEVEGARLAATRRDAADLKRIQAHLEARGDWHPEQTETTLPAFVERDTNFHLAVMQAGHNQALLAMYRFFSDQWARTIVHTQRDGTLPTPTLQQHRELFEAIADNDTHATVHAVQAMLAPALAAARSRGNDHAPPR
ncbi:MAG: FadR family transcriptional regulator [Rhodanobacter sp.]|nr:MAG: FadR family transcriptional regulator [Rhodanobacter sp.]